MGKQHGSLSRAGKVYIYYIQVRKQTPKVDKMERAKKVPKGRALKR